MDGREVKFQKQTILDDTNGNCLAACISSLLDANIDDVPNPQKDWWHEVNKWLLENHACEMMNITFNENHMPSIPMIAVGDSPNYPGKKHAVLWKNKKMIFDPSPNDKGLNGKPEYYIVLLWDYTNPPSRPSSP